MRLSAVDDVLDLECNRVWDADKIIAEAKGYLEPSESHPFLPAFRQVLIASGEPLERVA